MNSEDQIREYREYLLLLEYISCKPTDEIKRLINHKTQVIQCFTDFRLTTLLVFMIERNDAELCRFALEHRLFQSAKLGRDENSCNVLHTAAKHGNAEILETIISHITEEEIKALCWQIDKKGKLPISLLEENEICSDEDYEKMLNLLADLTESITLIPLTQPLDFEEIKKEFAQEIANNAELEKNLEIGTIIANSVRRKIKYSSSHTNCGDDDQIIPTLRNLRKILKEKTGKVKRSTLNVYLENLVMLTNQCETANCMELSYLGADALFKMGTVEPFRIVYFLNGDHYYLVYPQPQGKINDFTNASNSVSIDIWRGKVYPFRLSPSLLTCYQNPLQYRIIFPYDEINHRLSTVKFEFNTTFFADSYNLGTDNFTPAEKKRIEVLLGNQRSAQAEQKPLHNLSMFRLNESQKLNDTKPPAEAVQNLPLTRPQ